MAKPSVSLPDEVKEEIDDRRHSKTHRSTWLQEAATVRLVLEDLGEWDEQLARAEDIGWEKTDATAPEA